MQEEFHGIFNGSITTAYQQKYGWETLTASVWLPGLSELVGYTGEEHSDAGTYLSAMQGMNMSGKWYWVDPNGGTQFSYFAQYNANGGGQKIWDTCNRQQTWLRSVNHAYATHAWRTTDASNLNTSPATASFAVHPAKTRNAGETYGKWEDFVEILLISFYNRTIKAI